MITAALRQQVFATWPACLKCGSAENLAVDHVMPSTKGGRDEFENLQTLCRSCNSIKGDRTIDYRGITADSYRDLQARSAPFQKMSLHNVRVSEDEYARLDAECKRKQVTLTELIREYLRSLPPADDKEKSPPEAPS